MSDEQPELSDEDSAKYWWARCGELERRVNELETERDAWELGFKMRYEGEASAWMRRAEAAEAMTFDARRDYEAEKKRAEAAESSMVHWRKVAGANFDLADGHKRGKEAAESRARDLQAAVDSLKFRLELVTNCWLYPAKVTEADMAWAQESLKAFLASLSAAQPDIVGPIPSPERDAGSQPILGMGLACSPSASESASTAAQPAPVEPKPYRPEDHHKNCESRRTTSNDDCSCSDKPKCGDCGQPKTSSEGGSHCRHYEPKEGA